MPFAFRICPIRETCPSRLGRNEDTATVLENRSTKTGTQFYTLAYVSVILSNQVSNSLILGDNDSHNLESDSMFLV